MAKFLTFTFPSSDGVHDCYACQWLPEEGSPRAVVQLVHGISEYVGRYDHFARFLADHGFAVCGEDHLGHGRTAAGDDSFGFVAGQGGWMLMAEDVRTLRQRMGEQYPGIPYIIMGHSMGSFLTRTYLCRWPGTIDGAILSGTGQETAPIVAAGKALASLIAGIKGATARSPMVHSMALGAYNKQFAPNRTPSDWISRDEAVVDAYRADEYCAHMPSVGLYRDMLGGLQYIASPQNLSRMDPDTPVYIFSGDRDPVGANGRTVKTVYGYFEKQGTKDLSMKLYAGGRHEMLNELNKEEVYADVLNWLERHI